MLNQKLYRSLHNICEHNKNTHYHNIYVDKSLGDYAPELIVKCRYEETEEGKIQAVFTPFAVMDSISMEEAWKMFSCFYMNTNYF